MNDEFNPQDTNNTNPTTNDDYKKTQQSVFSNTSPEEFPKYGNVAASSAKKKAKTVSKLFMTFAATVSAVLVGTAIVNTDSTQVVFHELTATDRSIVYSIELANRSDKEFSLVISNQFTTRVTTIEDIEFSGIEYGLKSNMTYDVEVKSGNKTIAKRSIRVLKPEEMPKTEFYSVDWECTCEVDDLFRFTMNFVDGNHYWYGFTATLTDCYDTTAICNFNSDLHSEQTINVIENDLFSDETRPATLVITCKAYEPDENGMFPDEPKDIVLYTAEVII